MWSRLLPPPSPLLFPSSSMAVRPEERQGPSLPHPPPGKALCLVWEAGGWCWWEEGAYEAPGPAGSPVLPLAGPPGQVWSEQLWIVALGFVGCPQGGPGGAAGPAAVLSSCFILLYQLSRGSLHCWEAKLRQTQDLGGVGGGSV